MQIAIINMLLRLFSVIISSKIELFLVLVLVLVHPESLLIFRCTVSCYCLNCLNVSHYNWLFTYLFLCSFGKDNDDVTLCQMGSLPTYLTRTVSPGDYITKVRAISPAGNGSWSEPVLFTIEDTVAEKNTAVVIGVSIGAAVLILSMMLFVVYYAFFRRYVNHLSIIDVA